MKTWDWGEGLLSISILHMQTGISLMWREKYFLPYRPRGHTAKLWFRTLFDILLIGVFIECISYFIYRYMECTFTVFLTPPPMGYRSSNFCLTEKYYLGASFLSLGYIPKYKCISNSFAFMLQINTWLCDVAEPAARWTEITTHGERKITCLPLWSW